MAAPGQDLPHGIGNSPLWLVSRALGPPAAATLSSGPAYLALPLNPRRLYLDGYVPILLR